MAYPLLRFQKTVRSWDIPYFQPHELLVLGGSHHSPDSKGYGLNTYPPEDLWPNAEEALRVAAMAREAVGPIIITSAYRSPAYNRAIGGVRYSQHLQFRALDLIPLHTYPRDLHRVLLQMRRDGLWRGGLGKYNDFIHIDTRGRNASWG